jgi:hypothetical protein
MGMVFALLALQYSINSQMFEGNEPAEKKECLLCSSSFVPNMMLVILEVTQLLWLQLN